LIVRKAGAFSLRNPARLRDTGEPESDFPGEITNRSPSLGQNLIGSS